ncbi:transposase [Micromonospora sp. MMS20-R2-23]|uniref:Transposase n=1 Tax=Micromonospora antibiotica TaxID=2807623 RepID=A0ABS3V0Z4_9ACTN|nr:transposase [Micromonospora antibiotica]
MIDDHGHLITHTRLPDNPEGLARLLAALAAIRRNRRSIPIGIETGRSLMVAGLLKAGQPNVVLNPTQVANYRSRLAAQRKKSDRGDAHLLAHVLRVDRSTHRAQTPRRRRPRLRTHRGPGRVAYTS